MLRLLLADDHTLFRAGLSRVISDGLGMQVIAEADDAASTLRMCEIHDVDVLICDLTMPGVQGTSLITSVRKFRPDLPILVLSMHEEAGTVRNALQAGATGYLTKEASPDSLRLAITKVARGERHIPAELAAQLAFASLSQATSAHDSLSAREREVFRLIVLGKSLAQIGEQLHLSPKTITTHKTHLMEKLGVENNSDLIRYALEHRLFE